MILYNVTFGIDREIEPEWVLWMKETHIPEMLSTGIFTGHKFYKVLSHEVEGTSSYCIQYFTLPLYNSTSTWNYLLQNSWRSIASGSRTGMLLLTPCWKKSSSTTCLRH